MGAAERITKRRVGSERDLTKGSIIGNLLMLSWPIIILNGLWSVTLIIEMIWVGKLGAASMAGVGVAGFVTMLVMTVKRGICIGAIAMVARFVGAGDVTKANHIAGQGFVIGVAYSAVVAAIGVFFAESILSLFGLEVNAVAEGATYLRIALAGWVTEALWMMSFSMMQASGDSVTPMKIAIFLRSIHAVICPFLVLGWWVFPRLGVSGAATAYVAASGLGMIIGLWALSTGRTRLRLTLRSFHPDPKIIWRILKIAIPASVMGLQSSFGNLALAWFMAPFGTLAVAAHSLTQRVQIFVNMPAGGVGRGAGVLVGQYLGADQPERAERSGWLAAGLLEGLMIVCSVVVLLWAESIASIFTAEPDLVVLGGIFLRIAAVSYLVACVILLQDCISGAGDTLPPMLVGLAMIWVVQLPLAFFLPRVTDLGVYGVRWAIVIGMAVGAIAYLIYFKLGRWKRKRV
jgi:putative MATE family efflux protein